MNVSSNTKGINDVLYVEQEKLSLIISEFQRNNYSHCKTHNTVK